MTPIVANYADIIVIVLMAAGVFFHFVASLGILRMPDLYMRISGMSMAGTLGTSCFMIAAAVHFANSAIVCRTFVVIFFIFITSPISGHILGRAAYLSGLPLWHKSVVDQCKPVLQREADEKKAAEKKDDAKEVISE